MEKDYNKTLNLPKTEFPMRGNLPEKEPKTLANWESDKLYHRIMEKNKNKVSYVLHDGPPYANGNIHMGHALNKILKDIIVKYKNMDGFKAPFVPGWDTHGLPTEIKARAKVGSEKAKTMSIKELRTLCAEFAVGYVETQKEQFKRLGVFGDWGDPHVTLFPEYEAEQVRPFAKMAEQPG
ncbi:MAG: class I tRNA ligase family protein, partial [Clostridia bacterium]|nr:class I tRNA ligase family protein [Clostridia bacterium]